MPGRKPKEVAPHVVRVPNLIVNAYLVGRSGAASGEWVLVDAGLPGARRPILRAVRRRFGKGSRPAAIVLTHGHFDHVGAVEDLAERWDVPVYAHKLEVPHLTGQAAYPPPDPRVGGGMMARLAPLYPNNPIDLGSRLQKLPDDGSVPGMPDWRWVHTPGHTAGHISLFRGSDRTLIAGDAFITVKQESALAVLTQKKKVHGPPAYFTSDWREAWRSVQKLAELRPEVAATGHGVPMRGKKLHDQLDRLARRFDEKALPKKGRYVRFPAVSDEEGVKYVPPRPRRTGAKILKGMGLAALAGLVSAAFMARN